MLLLAAYVTLSTHPSWNPYVDAPYTHMYVVSITAFVTLLVSIFIGVTAYRLRNIQLLCLSFGFISLTELFTLHGISTPGIMMDSNLFTEVTAELSVTLLGAWMWVSSLPSDAPIMRWLARHHVMLLPMLALFLGIIDGLLLSIDQNWGFLVRQPTKLGVAAICLVFYALAGSRYYRSYRYSRLPLQRAIVSSTCLLCVVQVIMSTAQVWTVSWWSYHAILFVSVVIIIAGIAKQYASDASLGTAIRGIFATDPMERIEAAIGPKVRAMILETERRDPYTAGHNTRVAMYAVALGRQMGIPPEQLRALAQGGSIHDVGKIHIADHILNKPGRLTDVERRIIEQHPVIGYELCKGLGFMQDELEIIRHHHERYDGLGYPDGLRGAEIPLLSRITSVADVYDALTSSRSYRAALPHELAMQMIADGAGTQFDPACVSAWQSIDFTEQSTSSGCLWPLEQPSNTQVERDV